MLLYDPAQQVSCLCSHIFPTYSARVGAERVSSGSLQGQRWVRGTVLCPTPLPTFCFNLSVRELLLGLGEWKQLPLLTRALISVCGQTQSRAEEGFWEWGACVPSSGPWQPWSFQFHTVVLKKPATRFPLTSWLLSERPGSWTRPRTGRGCETHLPVPTVLFWNMKQVKYHHHFCRRQPYWFQSPFAWTHPVCLCSYHKWLRFLHRWRNRFRGRRCFTWSHHWFQKSWNLGKECLCDKREVRALQLERNPNRPPADLAL